MIADLLDLTQARLGGVIPLTRGRTDLQQVCEEVMLEMHAAYPDAILRLERSGNLIGATGTRTVWPRSCRISLVMPFSTATEPRSS